MHPIGVARLAHEAHLGWRPIVIRVLKHAQLFEQLYDAVERDGRVFAMRAGSEVFVHPDEFAVIAWAPSDAALKRIGVQG
jgi:hypothetical protein